jgi:hypothetical protein
LNRQAAKPPTVSKVEKHLNTAEKQGFLISHGLNISVKTGNDTRLITQLVVSPAKNQFNRQIANKRQAERKTKGI